MNTSVQSRRRRIDATSSRDAGVGLLSKGCYLQTAMSEEWTGNETRLRWAIEYAPIKDRVDDVNGVRAQR